MPLTHAMLLVTCNFKTQLSLGRANSMGRYGKWGLGGFGEVPPIRVLKPVPAIIRIGLLGSGTFPEGLVRSL